MVRDAEVGQEQEHEMDQIENPDAIEEQEQDSVQGRNIVRSEDGEWF